LNSEQPDLNYSLAESIFFTVKRENQKKMNEWKREVLVIIGNRFGMNEVSRDYYPAIKKFMKLPSFVGLVGGQPRAAYYFCGLVERPTES